MSEKSPKVYVVVYGDDECDKIGRLKSDGSVEVILKLTPSASAIEIAKMLNNSNYQEMQDVQF